MFGLGYYSVGVIKFGVVGDFIIVFEFGELFVCCVVYVVQGIFVQFGDVVEFFEFGVGSGVFVEVVLCVM